MDVAKAKVEKWNAEIGLREARVGVQKAVRDVEHFEKAAVDSGTSKDRRWAIIAKDILEERREVARERKKIVDLAKAKVLEAKEKTKAAQKKLERALLGGAVPGRRREGAKLTLLYPPSAPGKGEG